MASEEMCPIQWFAIPEKDVLFDGSDEFSDSFDQLGTEVKEAPSLLASRAAAASTSVPTQSIPLTDMWPDAAYWLIPYLQLVLAHDAHDGRGPHAQPRHDLPNEEGDGEAPAAAVQQVVPRLFLAAFEYSGFSCVAASDVQFCPT
jgi:hypothetical protein